MRGRLLSIAALLFIFGASAEAQAQACPAGKFCYYVPASAVGPGQPFVVDWDLILASSSGTVSGSYRIGNGSSVPFSVTTTTPLIVDLSDTEGVASGYGTAERRGIFVEADSQFFSVTRRLIDGPWQSSASIKDHTRGLGRRFRLGGYTLNSTRSGNAFDDGDAGFDFVSVYAPAGATVTVSAPPGATAPFWDGFAGLDATFTLGVGETYVLRTRRQTTETCAVDITGALLLSNEDVSVTTGGRGWSFLGGPNDACVSSGTCGDDGEDHLIPADRVGEEYVVGNYNTDPMRRVAVVADTNSTEVRIDGQLVATLMAGESYYFQPTAVTSIVTSRPAYVFQNAARSNCEVGMAFLPPVSFASRNTNTAAFNVVGSGRVSVLVETPQVNTVRFNGTPLSNPTITAVPQRPQWSVVEFDVPAGTHTVDADSDFQLGLATGTSLTGLFAYYNIFNDPGCGDSVLDSFEGCDDGNTAPGDGCSAQCRVEIGTSGCTRDRDCVPGAFCDTNSICVGCINDSDCNDGNPCTIDTCNASVCSNASEAAGTSCPGGVCNGESDDPNCVFCIDDEPDASVPDTGCFIGAPACTSNGSELSCTPCSNNADCDDGDPCTEDTCFGGRCLRAAAPAGTACMINAMGGVCDGIASAPVCQVCIDDNLDQQNGQDTGCDAATPFCDRSGETARCVADLTPPECGDGIVDEPCDDGNRVDGDGCSANCLIEIGTAGCIVDSDCVDMATCSGGTCEQTTDLVITSPTNGEVIRDSTVTVTGQGEPGSQVDVTVGEQTLTVEVDENGMWNATFENVEAGAVVVTVDGPDGSQATVTIEVVRDAAGDAGMADSGMADAGLTDAGLADTGTGGDGVGDAGNSGDASGGSSSSAAADEGCGCASTPGGSVPVSPFIVLLALVFARLRRSASRE